MKRLMLCLLLSGCYAPDTPEKIEQLIDRCKMRQMEWRVVQYLGGQTEVFCYKVYKDTSVRYVARDLTQEDVWE